MKGRRNKLGRNRGVIDGSVFVELPYCKSTLLKICDMFMTMNMQIKIMFP